MKFLISLLLLFSSSKLCAQERGSSFPYISGDTFRDYCDYIVDETAMTLTPERVRAGEVIFLKTDYLEYFFHQLHPRIAQPYILVTHNSDYSFPGAFACFLEDPKLIAWFGQNLVEYQHPKLHPIPIGLANRCWPHGSVETLHQMRQKISKENRKILLHMNFQPYTYPQERYPLFEMFKNRSYCTVRQPTDFRSYLSDLAQSKFVLSPRGNGLDTHRTWEALWMGAIPIVKTSSLDPLFEGLPVLIIRDWSEISESFLEAKWKEMQTQKWQLEKLDTRYWFRQIAQKKR